MENLDNKWVLSASSNDDCKEKDGNNPVTLGLENMRGVRLVITLLERQSVQPCHCLTLLLNMDKLIINISTGLMYSGDHNLET